MQIVGYKSCRALQVIKNYLSRKQEELRGNKLLVLYWGSREHIIAHLWRDITYITAWDITVAKTRKA